MNATLSSIKLGLFLIATLAVIPFQALWLLLFSKSSIYYKLLKYYQKFVCWLYNINVTVQGNVSQQANTIFVGNHISYIDIVAIGAFLEATFIAKADVRHWPLLGVLIRLNKTVFIERTRDAAPKAIASIKKAIDTGCSLIIFPEGTSTQGVSVLPFKSSIFDLFLKPDLKEKLSVQPFTISIINVNGAAPKTAYDLDLYAWHGDMTLLPHLWTLGKSKGATIEIKFHTPRRANDYSDRKEFARDCHKDVAQGLTVNFQK